MERAFRSQKRGLDTLEVFESTDTSTPFGKFFYQIRNVFVDLERNIIRERTIAGMETARTPGDKIGTPHKLSHCQIAVASEKLSSAPSLNCCTVARDFDAPTQTLLRAMK